MVNGARAEWEDDMVWSAVWCGVRVMSRVQETRY